MKKPSGKSAKHRRANGSGSVFLDRAKKRWAYTLEKPSQLGEKRQRIRRYAATQAEAQVKLEELRAQFRKGGGEIDKRTVANLLDLWLTNHVASLKPKTRASYRDQLERFIRPGLGNRVLREVRAEHIDAFLNAAQKEGMSKQGRAYLRDVLRSAFGYALRLDWIDRNVVQRSTTVAKTPKPMVVWSRDEVATFLRAAKDTTLESLFRFAVGTGCRIGEMLGLRWACVDFGKRSVSIEAQLQHIRDDDVGNGVVGKHLGACWYLTTPKTTRGTRTIETATVTDVLAAHRERQLILVAAQFDLVFTAVNGMPLNQSNVRREFERLIRVSGVPRIRLHDIRHTTATLLLEDGVPPHVVQNLLGHADVATTLRFYGHVTRRQTADVAQRLGVLATGG